VAVRLLSLHAAMYALVVTMMIQLGYAYYHCRRAALAPGRIRASLVRPLATYGLSQLAAVTPRRSTCCWTSSSCPSWSRRRTWPLCHRGLDHADPVPLVSAIGNVAFPRLAAQRTVTAQGSGCSRPPC